MKTLILLVLATIGTCTTSCDICLKLSQFSFDYTPLITSNACENDSTCESILKELSWQFVAKGYSNSPCTKNSGIECLHFGPLVCDDIVGEVCSARMSSNSKDLAKKAYSTIKSEISDLEDQLKSDVSKYKHKFLDILGKFDEVEKIV